LAEGIVTETAHGLIHEAQIRDLQFLVTGNGFFDEEKRDTRHSIEYLHADSAGRGGLSVSGGGAGQADDPGEYGCVRLVPAENSRRRHARMDPGPDGSDSHADHARLKAVAIGPAFRRRDHGQVYDHAEARHRVPGERRRSPHPRQLEPARPIPCRAAVDSTGALGGAGRLLASTTAAIITGLIVAADVARQTSDAGAAAWYEARADLFAASIERAMFTARGRSSSRPAMPATTHGRSRVRRRARICWPGPCVLGALSAPVAPGCALAAVACAKVYATSPGLAHAKARAFPSFQCCDVCGRARASDPRVRLLYHMSADSRHRRDEAKPGHPSRAARRCSRCLPLPAARRATRSAAALSALVRPRATG
jgi:hypothetical protein